MTEPQIIIVKKTSHKKDDLKGIRKEVKVSNMKSMKDIEKKEQCKEDFYPN